jgi:hypothetical protein
VRREQLWRATSEGFVRGRRSGRGSSGQSRPGGVPDKLARCCFWSASHRMLMLKRNPAHWQGRRRHCCCCVQAASVGVAPLVCMPRVCAPRCNLWTSVASAAATCGGPCGQQLSDTTVRELVVWSCRKQPPRPASDRIKSATASDRIKSATLWWCGTAAPCSSLALALQPQAAPLAGHRQYIFK